MSDLSQSTRSAVAKCEEAVRSRPFAAVGGAAIVGMLLTPRLIGSVLGLTLRLAFALLRPAALGFAIWKLVQLRQAKTESEEIPS